ncbi:MAG: thiamine-monophosphate kinase, partial [Nitrospirales bacterium]|nr:thiamine-monophosphate kinase [Nitrospirales bacterium]
MSGKRLRQRGESSLLRDVRKRFEYHGSGIIRGIGDDAAVVFPPREKLLVTTDMMNEGVHFDLSFISPFQLGYKLVSVNVSDIYAMGGKPLYVFLNLAMKAETEEEFFWDLYDGLATALDFYGAKLLGGDLCGVRNEMVLSATVIGSAENPVLRSGASAGDRVYVSGTPGDSACGLEILRGLGPGEREKVKRMRWGHGEMGTERSLTAQSLVSPELRELSWDVGSSLIRRHLMPEARDSSVIGRYATAMIDLSDGLFIDLSRLCEESGVGVRLFAEQLPISREMKEAAEKIGADPFHLAVSGGEDYE